MEREASKFIDKIDDYHQAEEVCKEILGLTKPTEIQSYFNRFTPKFYKYLIDSNPGFILPVQTLLKDSGYVVNGSNVNEFVQYLWNMDFACGRILDEDKNKKRKNSTFNFILGRDVQPALTIWGTSRQLREYKKSPVIELFGREFSTPPYPSQLNNKDNFGRVANLLKELGIEVRGHQKLGMTDVLTEDCPVPVFTYQGGYCYRKEDERALRMYLSDRKWNLLRQGKLILDDLSL